MLVPRVARFIIHKQPQVRVAINGMIVPILPKPRKSVEPDYRLPDCSQPKLHKAIRLTQDAANSRDEILAGLMP